MLAATDGIFCASAGGDKLESADVMLELTAGSSTQSLAVGGSSLASSVPRPLTLLAVRVRPSLLLGGDLTDTSFLDLSRTCATGSASLFLGLLLRRVSPREVRGFLGKPLLDSSPLTSNEEHEMGPLSSNDDREIGPNSDDPRDMPLNSSRSESALMGPIEFGGE